MPYYASTEQFYTVMEALFTQVAQNNKAVRPLLQSRLTIGLRTTSPAGIIAIDARKKPIDIQYGEMSIKPVLDVTLPADTLHRILMDELSLLKAMGQKVIQVKGPVMKAMALAELFKQGRKYYPAIVQEKLS